MSTVSSSVATPDLSPTTSRNSSTASSNTDPSPATSGICTPCSGSSRSQVDVGVLVHGEKAKLFLRGCHEDVVPLDTDNTKSDGNEECCVEEEDSSSRVVRNSLASMIRRARSIALRRFNVARTIRKRRSRLSDSEDEASNSAFVEGSSAVTSGGPSVEAEDKSSPLLVTRMDAELCECFTPQDTNDLDAAALQDFLSELPPTQPPLGNTEKVANLSTLSLLAVHGSPIPVFDDPRPTSTILCQPSFVRSSLSLSSLPLNILRVLIFIPWCISLGLIILIFPSQLPTFAPAESKLLPGIPPPGPRRFAYWAECALPHIAIFLSVVFGVTLKVPYIGTCITAGILAATVHTWCGFTVVSDKDGQGVRLGENDWESVWLVLTGKYLRDDCKVVVGKKLNVMLAGRVEWEVEEFEVE